MQDTFPALLQIVDHLSTPALTIVMLLFFVFFSKIKPYLKYVKLVANADTEEGQIELAKYIASQTGGKHILTDDVWEAFLPAAKALREIHEVKKENTNSSK